MMDALLGNQFLCLFDPIMESKRLKAGQDVGLCPLSYLADNKRVSKLTLGKYSAFRRLKAVTSVFQVLWRYNGAVPEKAPKNVKLMKWLPQNDLLGASCQTGVRNASILPECCHRLVCCWFCSSAHPKAKVFITHGGSHGIFEGICNGVPMLMFPLFGDQSDNVQRMVHRGVAEKLSIYDVTSDKLVAALKKIIQDKR